MDHTYYEVCRRYYCSTCVVAHRQYTFDMWDPRVLKLLHSKVSQRLDVLFTYKCAVTRRVADYIWDHATSATSFEVTQQQHCANLEQHCDLIEQHLSLHHTT